ncbi:hypothetical protein DPMN_086627 [Dreissena polymorpha]|uniref:Uncharacterized protein n=1 Tax=Dreissena polymorpha TaxID=45954 RepID=A0A9D4KRT7_DREPO|nr:hypothetical protein DPMN_086627 [Dreissena polymorpha]
MDGALLHQTGVENTGGDTINGAGRKAEAPPQHCYGEKQGKGDIIIPKGFVVVPINQRQAAKVGRPIIKIRHNIPYRNNNLIQQSQVSMKTYTLKPPTK